MTTPSDAERDYPVHWEADVVLRDGGIAHVRPIAPDDAGRLVSFYEKVSDESKYYRFFAPYPRLSDRDVHRFTHHDYHDRVGLAALVGGEFIATVRYDRTDDGEAEVAFLVQDAHQGRGVASALMEHIAAVAQERGIRRFIAEVLPANRKMIKVFTDAGYTQQRSFTDGVVRLEFDLEPTEQSLAVMRAREQRAEARSVQRLLAPASVAVIGAGRRPGGVGRGVLRNIVAGGYTGRVHAVNRSFPEDLRTLEPEGVPAHRSVAEIPDTVDLAVIAVPADDVAEAVDACGRHGVLGLLVISSGYAESGAEGRRRQRALVRQALTYGMRVIGPNAFGILNSADDVRLNASLSPETPDAGRLGLFTQSGAIGIALLSGLRRRGAGLSSFVSAGNRADVSGNDILQFWYDDPATDVALLYLETLGNPRKFYRLARRTAAVKPVVAVKGARHSAAAPPGHAVPPPASPTAPSPPCCSRPASSAPTPSPSSSTPDCCCRAGRCPRDRASRSSATPSPSGCSPTTPASPRGWNPASRSTSPPPPARRTSGPPSPRPSPTRPTTPSWSRPSRAWARKSTRPPRAATTPRWPKPSTPARTRPDPASPSWSSTPPWRPWPPASRPSASPPTAPPIAP